MPKKATWTGLAYLGCAEGEAGLEAARREISDADDVLPDLRERAEAQQSELEALRANPELMPNAVEEALRFEPPVQHMTRIALEDMDFHGVHIRKHQLCEVYIGSANRDPEANPDPDVFDICRDNIEHVGFGYGIHLCLGAQLARLETQIALTMLLERFPRLTLTGAPPAWGDSTFVRGLDELLLAA